MDGADSGEPGLTADDQTAAAWALASRSPGGLALAARLQRGEQTLTEENLPTIRAEWEAAGRPVPERHVHRTVVEFADGTSVTAVSFDAGDPYGRERAPDFGLYFDDRWDPPWPHERLHWEDFGVPDASELRSSLVQLLTRARSGERVELGCIGGHGPTGTALACLAVMTGSPPTEAVAWVRAHHCHGAVETDE